MPNQSRAGNYEPNSVRLKWIQRNFSLECCISGVPRLLLTPVNEGHDCWPLLVIVCGRLGHRNHFFLLCASLLIVCVFLFFFLLIGTLSPQLFFLCAKKVCLFERSFDRVCVFLVIFLFNLTSFGRFGCRNYSFFLCVLDRRIVVCVCFFSSYFFMFSL